MVTLVYAGVLVLIGLYLAYRSSMKRLSTEIMIGTGDNTEMLQASRVHGNFVEYVPFFLILSGALELSGQLPTLALYILGDIFVLVSLDFLGYGLKPPTSSWGNLLAQASENLDNWHMLIFPIIILTLTIFMITFISEAVREAFDPKVYSRLK